MPDQQLQLDLERLFNKNQLIPRIRREFEEANFASYMQDRKIPENFGMALLVQMVLHKRTTLPTLVGILRHHFEDEINPAQACADMLYRAAEADLVNWDSHASPHSRDPGRFIIIWDVSPDVRAELDRYQYPLPMVIEPLELRHNDDSGYLTIKRSAILRDNHLEGDICLDHLNRTNRTRLQLNHDTARMVRLKWKGLDKPKEDDKPGDYEKRVKQFQKYVETTDDVMEHLAITAESGFYLTHRYDFRGRMYAQGYHCNYQSTSWNKAVVELAKQEVTQ